MSAHTTAQLFSLENSVFRAYLFYCSVLVLKMMFMSLLTAATRMSNKAFANPEDSAMYRMKPTTNDKVERVRRAHLNDLENIPIFTVAAFVYLMTGPSAWLAKTLFLAFTVSRFAHTLVYAVVVVPQPARGLAFFVGFAITAYMAVHGAMHFMV
nr:unnamed protein product [Callosobruchus chinensis]